MTRAHTPDCHTPIAIGARNDTNSTMKFGFHNPFSLRRRDKASKPGERRFNRKKFWRAVKLAALGLVFFTSALFAWYAKDLPTPGKIRKRQAIESTKIIDRDGELLYEVHGDQNRTILKAEDIPDTVKQATLTAEDRNFYNHIGVDFKGLARSVFRNVFTGSRVGGSTITQQFVKNAILTNKKSLDRKIKELILSLEIEAMFSKDEILTFYLNEIPYGNNNYGIESAAKAFFGKDAKDLTLDESALLAAIPQRPTYFSPYGTHTDELKVRRNWILQSMVELGYSTQALADEAMSKEITVLPRRDSIEAAHFVFYVREQLVEMFDEQTVEEGGLTVTTSLDVDFQRKAQDAINAGMSKVQSYNGSNAALVSVKPETGEILAMVGSHDYFDTEHDGNVNVTLAERQPGSSFKPIVYAAGFKSKYNPGTVLWDVPTDFGNYRPNNYNGNFNGPVTIRQALSNSLNIPAVKMLGLVGLDEALKTANDMGLTTLTDRDRYGLSLVLGGGEVRPLDMAGAFAVFANGGTYRPPVSILKVESPDGKVLFEHRQGKGEKEVLDPNIAAEITDILSDNNARSLVFGTRSALYFPNRPVAAKTGTTQEFRDAWTVGYTPGLSTAVWVGNNNNTPMRGGADGSVVAAPIFHTYIETALAGNDIRQFTKPSTLKSITVDKLSNKLPTDKSPETITDLFAPWQVPTERDNIHQIVKVNKINGKLATDLTPASFVEERVYTVIHSEKPKDPNWENPVLAWARDHGIEVGTPPTETDDQYTQDSIPKLSITSPSDEQTVAGNFTVDATASASLGIRSVDLEIDGIGQGFDATAPYSFSLKASELGVGEHKITVTVYDINGASTSQTITISIGNDTTPPGSVTGVTAESRNKGARLVWNNPTDPDVERVRLYVSTNPGQIGTLHPTEILVSPGSQGSLNLGDLANGTTYFFTLHAVDTSGNEAKTTASQASATPGS